MTTRDHQRIGADDAEMKQALVGLGRDVKAFTERHQRAFDDLKGRVEAIEEHAAGMERPGRPDTDRKQFTEYLRTGQGLESKTTTGATASGALIPSRVASDIVAKALGRSRIGDLVRRTKTDSADYRRVVRVGGVVSGWSSETGTRSAGAGPEYVARVPSHGELYGVYSASNWVIQDSHFDLVRELQDAIAAQFGMELETAIISGNGTNRPTGILHNAPTSAGDAASPQRAAGVIQYIPSGVAGSLGHLPTASPERYGDNVLLDAFFSLRPEYRPNATWVMNSATLATVRKFKDREGQAIWQPTLGHAVDQGNSGDGLLLGRPVMTVEAMPAIGSNAHPILVGDFQQAYELVEIHGLSITRDDVTTPGLTKFYIRARFGGCVLDNNAVKAVKCAAS